MRTEVYEYHSPVFATRSMVAVVVVVIVAAGCAGDSDAYEGGTPGATRPGGETTVEASGTQAFSLPASNLDAEGLARFRVGDRFFTDPWLAAPAPQDDRDGLGPTYLADSCIGCHVAVGKAPAPQGDVVRGALIRIGRSGGSYGPQIQDHSVGAVPAEAQIAVWYREEVGTFEDGTGYTLRRPVLDVRNQAFGDVAEGGSVRVAQHLIGLGLLEAISAEAIQRAADPEDADGDGVSGRASVVGSGALNQETLGRFGWKATAATVADQTAAAFHQDMGITSALHPEENCPPPQTACAAAPTGGSPEIGESRFAAVVFYTQTLGVPARRRVEDPAVIAGEALFHSLGCTACHTVVVTTGDHDVGAVAGQLIYPYTDLLLHDMGAGLASGHGEGSASAREWRTAPLWGIGLVSRVNPAAGFLHDGRARTLEEAVLWHGGESAEARDGYRTLDASDRRRVIAFLESL